MLWPASSINMMLHATLQPKLEREQDPGYGLDGMPFALHARVRLERKWKPGKKSGRHGAPSSVKSLEIHLASRARAWEGLVQALTCIPSLFGELQRPSTMPSFSAVAARPV